MIRAASLLLPLVLGVLVPIYTLLFERLAPDDANISNDSRLFHVSLILKLFGFTIRWADHLQTCLHP